MFYFPQLFLADGVFVILKEKLFLFFGFFFFCKQSKKVANPTLKGFFCFFFVFLSFVFLGPYPQHVEVPRLGI